MENYFNSKEQQGNNLIVDELGQSYLLDTARWGRFIGIVYAVAILLVCLFFPLILIHNPQYETLANSGYAIFFTIFYIVFLIGINFYPLYALIKSAVQAQKAVLLNDQ